MAAPMLAVLGLAGCASSSFEPYTEESSVSDKDQTVEGAAVKSVMAAIGAIDPAEKPVEYKPRAKLVIPPKRDLRTPEDPNAVASRGNFPVNPEERSTSTQYGNNGKELTPEEMRKLHDAAPVTAPIGSGGRDASRALTLEEMQRGHDASALAAKGKRKTLIVPPDTYSKPSPNAPFEEEKEKSTSWKPSWWPL